MADGNTHAIIGGIAVGAVLFLVNMVPELITKMPIFAFSSFKLIDWIIIIAVTWVYAQLPDIDSDVSVANKVFNTGLAILIIYAVLNDLKLQAIAAAATFGVMEWIKHRGITHTIIVAIVASWLLWLINPLYAIVGFIAYASHLIKDGEFRLFYTKSTFER